MQAQHQIDAGVIRAMDFLSSRPREKDGFEAVDHRHESVALDATTQRMMLTQSARSASPMQRSTSEPTRPGAEATVMSAVAPTS